MGIGQRQPVQLVKIVVTQGTDGRMVEGDLNTYDLFAEIDNASNFRTYENSQTDLGTTKRFKIRHRFDLEPNCDWRIVYKGKRWTPSAIVEDKEKRFYWNITATSKADV